MSKRVVEELLTAMSWLEPPFVDARTPRGQIMARIELMLADKDRAIEYGRKRGELQAQAQGGEQ